MAGSPAARFVPRGFPFQTFGFRCLFFVLACVYARCKSFFGGSAEIGKKESRKEKEEFVQVSQIRQNLAKSGAVERKELLRRLAFLYGV